MDVSNISNPQTTMESTVELDVRLPEQDHSESSVEAEYAEIPNIVLPPQEHVEQNNNTSMHNKIAPAITNLMNVINSNLTALSLQAADVWIQVPASSDILSAEQPEQWTKYLFSLGKDPSLNMWNEVSASSIMSRPLTKSVPGRIISSQEPGWINLDESQEMSPDIFPRAATALSLGIRTTFGVPIFKKRSDPAGPYHGALMFYSTSLLNPSPQTISFIAESTMSIFYPEEISPVPGFDEATLSTMNQVSNDFSTPEMFVPSLQSLAMYPSLYQQQPGIFPTGGVSPAVQQQFNFLVQMREQQRLGQPMTLQQMGWQVTGNYPTVQPADSSIQGDKMTSSSSSRDSGLMTHSRNKGPGCSKPGCNKVAQGNTSRCIAHGGGKRCKVPGCIRGARDRFFCAAHGGGKRCATEGCDKSAVGATQHCTTHGGGRRCQHEKCNKSAQSSTKFCVKHGGGRKCTVEGCEKVARGRTMNCAGHGGGIRCGASGCRKAAVGMTQLCRAHKMERDTEPAATLYQLRQMKNADDGSPESQPPIMVEVPAPSALLLPHQHVEQQQQPQHEAQQQQPRHEHHEHQQHEADQNQQMHLEMPNMSAQEPEQQLIGLENSDYLHMDEAAPIGEDDQSSTKRPRITEATSACI